jgi:hypothetical protein
MLLQQYVEMTAVVEVEAATAEAARERALTELASCADWQPGDDAYDVEAFAIYEGERLIWER